MSQEIGIIPVGPRFIAIRSEPEEITEGGIHLPQKAQDREKRVQPEAIVVRVSPLLEKDPQGATLKPGMRVLLHSGAQVQEFRFGGKEYIMVDWAMVKGIYV